MLMVGWAVWCSRTLGGCVAGANIGMLLAFVIAVTIPGSADVSPARVGGWAIAGLISTGAAVALWPLFERVTTHNQAAKALLAVADLVEGMRSAAGERDLPRLEEAARQKVETARHAHAAMAKRPTGLARRARAFAQLLIELARILQLIDRPFTEQRPVVRPGLAQRARLVTAVVAALRSSADVLAGGRSPGLWGPHGAPAGRPPPRGRCARR